MNSSPASQASTTQRRAIACWRWERRSKRKQESRSRRNRTSRGQSTIRLSASTAPSSKPHGQKTQRKNFEIVLGRIEASGRSRKIFAAVRDLDDLASERVRSALRTAGQIG